MSVAELGFLKSDNAGGVRGVDELREFFVLVLGSGGGCDLFVVLKWNPPLPPLVPPCVRCGLLISGRSPSPQAGRTTGSGLSEGVGFT